MNFKTEVFAVLANIAWTYLLHEYYTRKRVNIINDDGRSLLLSHMIERQDCPLSTGIKDNLKAMKLIRDDVEHTLLGKADLKWLSLFQACCLNFEKALCDLFGNELSLQKDLSVALQFAKLTMDQAATLQKYQIPEHIEALDARIKADLSEEQLADLEYEFQVIYTLVNSSKIRSHMEFFHPDSEEAEQVRNILVKHKFADELYPHKPGQVVRLVAQRSGKQFNGRNHNQAWRRFEVRPRAGARQPENTKKEYCVYHAAHKDYTYSDQWVAFLVEQIETAEGYEAVRSFKL
ncbi:MAG: DUF3644 domain-containing protein [Chloroflexi bacterium]|nr:DUF3644 domain-containing protein [Chloroflexota bacterium]